MSKYIVIQSFVGSGTWYNTEENLHGLYNDVLIPSYKRYCDRHGYRHVIYTDEYELLEAVNSKSCSNHGNLYHQYLSILKHKEEDIDYIVLPDADFYVTRNAKPFPKTKGLAGDLWMKSSLQDRGKDPETFTAIYGGFQIMTKDIAIGLAEWIKQRMLDFVVKDKELQLHPNMLVVGEYLTEHQIVPEPLDFKYNYILDSIKLGERPWTDVDRDTGFWHLYGKNKSRQLRYVLQHADGI
jgi:hypothetical protein